MKSRANGAHESHGEAEIEQLAVKAPEVLAISSDRKELEGTTKGDRLKVLVSVLLRKQTAVSNDWIAQ
jgi:hypothetical protein